MDRLVFCDCDRDHCNPFASSPAELVASGDADECVAVDVRSTRDGFDLNDSGRASISVDLKS